MYWFLKHFYAEGGATEAYCSHAVCHSVCPQRISRHSLKTKRWNLQHKQKLIFDHVWIERISVLNLSSRARRDLLTLMAVAGDLDSWRQNYPQVAALQLVSSFVLQNSVTCPEKKFENAIDLAYTTLMHVQLIVQSRPSDYVVSTLHSVNNSCTCRLQLA